jgi:membrane associated rhomboid family serine protease
MLLRPFPRLTAAVFTITAIPSLVQFAYPALETNLRRDPSLIADGQLWRLVTSLVVQDGGVVATISNLGFLLVLGGLAERTLGARRWLLFYLAGAAFGQAAGLVFDTVGAGNSIALCGLAGGLAVGVWRGGRDLVAGAVGAFFCVLIGASAFDSTAAYVVAAVGAGLIVSQRARLPRWAYAGGVGIVGVALSAAANLHGPAILGGLLAGLIVYRVRA